MGLKNLVEPFFWQKYSRKVQLRIDTPYCVGAFSDEEAKERLMHFASGCEGSIESGNLVAFYWLVDPTDGIVVDARFQVFGTSALVAIAEAACELTVGKNYDQASRINSDFIEKYLRDKKDIPSLPEEVYMHLNLVIDALEKASKECLMIPVAEEYVAPPVTNRAIETIEGGFPGWKALSLKKKLAVIEQVIAEDVRPYIELDAGGIQVLNLLNDKEVIISYQGACATCHSATGATLSYIQHVIQAKVHPDLIVIPNI